MKEVSVICSVMDRESILELSLYSWLKFEEIKEIIICDWSSTRSLFSLAKKDNRIKIIRVEGERNFNISASFNLASDMCQCSEILKLDVDYFLNPYYNFFDFYEINENCFLTGTWKYEIPTLMYLNGMIYIKKENFQKVNGYREDLASYGHEDTDLYERLQKQLDLKHLVMENNHIVFHIPHEDSKRSENYAEKCIKKTLRENAIKCDKDFKNERIFDWKIRKVGDRNYIGNKI